MHKGATGEVSHPSPVAPFAKEDDLQRRVGLIVNRLAPLGAHTLPRYLH